MNRGAQLAHWRKEARRIEDELAARLDKARAAEQSAAVELEALQAQGGYERDRAAERASSTRAVREDVESALAAHRARKPNIRGAR